MHELIWVLKIEEKRMNLGSQTAKPMAIPNSNVSWKSADGVPDQFPAGLRVLVVDDDLTCLRILEKMLKNCLYEGITSSFSIFMPIVCTDLFFLGWLSIWWLVSGFSSVSWFLSWRCCLLLYGLKNSLFFWLN